MLTCKYQNCEAEIKTIFNTRHSSDRTPVVVITANGSHWLILTPKVFPTAPQAEQYGIKLAQNWIGKYSDKAKSLPRRAALAPLR